MIVIVGESGCGKSTLANNFANAHPDRFSRIVTYTTRPMRDGEKDGVDYHFINSDEFKRLAEDNFFVEHATYRGWQYGTSFRAIRDDLDFGIAVLTPSGLRRLQSLNYGDEIVSIYLCVDRASRLISLINRGDDIEEAYRRNLTDVGMFDGIENEVDHIIYNTKFHKSKQEVLKELEEKLTYYI